MLREIALAVRQRRAEMSRAASAPSVMMSRPAASVQPHRRAPAARRARRRRARGTRTAIPEHGARTNVVTAIAAGRPEQIAGRRGQAAASAASGATDRADA